MIFSKSRRQHGGTVRRWSTVLMLVMAGALASGCGGATDLTATNSSASSASTTGSSPTLTSPGTASVTDFCKALVKLQHTPDSDPAAAEQVLQQLKALAADAPAEIREDLQVEIEFGEDIARNGGTVNLTTQGSLLKRSGTATRDLNDWEAEHC